MSSGQLVQTADLRMHYLQRGTGDPVVLIHGFPETSYSWRHQLAALSEHYAVFAPDTRGFGQTDKPGTRVTRQILAQDVINFMDALGLERAAIVGHDWGGIVAFKLAIDWPHRVTRLALLDTLCTVWPRLAQHGYWFKAEPFPEEFKPSVCRMLERASGDTSSRRTLRTRPVARATTGTVLIRDWQGKSHHVTVLDRGVLYRKKNYRSLSQVARVITGCRWSGPLFFGLRGRSKEGSRGTR